MKYKTTNNCASTKVSVLTNYSRFYSTILKSKGKYGSLLHFMKQTSITGVLSHSILQLLTEMET